MTHLAVDGNGSVENSVHAKNGRLGRVDDGSAEHAAVDTTVADGESAARHVFYGNVVVTRLTTVSAFGVASKCTRRNP